MIDRARAKATVLSWALLLGAPMALASSSDNNKPAAPGKGAGASALPGQSSANTANSPGIPHNAGTLKAQPSPIVSGLRVISLAPSNTELLCSIGAGSDIIGVCTFCDYPQAVTGIKKVGTFVSVNLERISGLKPDYVLLVSGQEMLSSQLKHNHFKTMLLDNTHLQNIGKNVQKLGQLTGKIKEAEAAAQNFDLSLNALSTVLQSKTTSGASPAKAKPTVFYCVWPQPLMTAGRDCFLNEVITACGGINIAGDVAASYPRYSMEQLVLKNPDVLILPYEARGQSFLGRDPWTMLKAVKEKRLFFLPDQKHDMLSRPTLRVLSGMAWLASILHPELEGPITAWQKSDSFVKAQVGAHLSAKDQVQAENH